jgi:hypothetical protein
MLIVQCASTKTLHAPFQKWNWSASVENIPLRKSEKKLSESQGVQAAKHFEESGRRARERRRKKFPCDV